MTTTQRGTSFNNLAQQNQHLRQLLQKKQEEIIQLLNIISQYKCKFSIMNLYEQKILTLTKKLQQVKDQQNKQNQQIQLLNEKLQDSKYKQSTNVQIQITKNSIEGWCQTEINICEQILGDFQQTHIKDKKRQNFLNLKNKQKESSAYSIYQKIPTLENQQKKVAYQSQNYQKDDKIRYSYQQNQYKHNQNNDEHYLDQQTQTSFKQFIHSDSSNIRNNNNNQLKKFQALNKSLKIFNKEVQINCDGIKDKSVFEKNYHPSLQAGNEQQSFKKFRKLRQLKQFLSMSSQSKLTYTQSQNQKFLVSDSSNFNFTEKNNLSSTGFCLKGNHRQKKLCINDKLTLQKAKENKIKQSPSLQNLMRIKKCYEMLNN